MQTDLNANRRHGENLIKIDLTKKTSDEKRDSYVSRLSGKDCRFHVLSWRNHREDYEERSFGLSTSTTVQVGTCGWSSDIDQRKGVVGGMQWAIRQYFLNVQKYIYYETFVDKQLSLERKLILPTSYLSRRSSRSLPVFSSTVLSYSKGGDSKQEQ